MSEVTQQEFAKLIGLTPRAVSNLRDQGLPYRSEGTRILIQPAEAVRWYVGHKVARAKPSAPSSLDEARQRFESARAELQELELAGRRGELVTVKDHERLLSDAFARVASKLRALPVRVAASVTGKTMDARKAQAAVVVDEIYRELHDADDVPEAIA